MQLPRCRSVVLALPIALGACGNNPHQIGQRLLVELDRALAAFALGDAQAFRRSISAAQQQYLKLTGARDECVSRVASMYTNVAWILVPVVDWREQGSQQSARALVEAVRNRAPSSWAKLLAASGVSSPLEQRIRRCEGPFPGLLERDAQINALFEAARGEWLADVRSGIGDESFREIEAGIERERCSDAAAAVFGGYVPWGDMTSSEQSAVSYGDPAVAACLDAAFRSNSASRGVAPRSVADTCRSGLGR